MNRLHAHAGLFLILIVFMVLGTFYLQVTPLLETPDEPSHFSVVKYIADTLRDRGQLRLPPARTAPPDAGPVPTILPGPPVYYAPPLYYVLGALLIADLDTDGFGQAVIPNPNWARGWAPTPGRSPENKHVYVQTADQSLPYAGWAVAMRRLRLFSLLLGAVTVAGVYALARRFWPHRQDTGWALAATSLVALNPAFIFVTIGVTNDALLIPLCTWSFVLITTLGNPRRKPVGAVTAGLGDQPRDQSPGAATAGPGDQPRDQSPGSVTADPGDQPGGQLAEISAANPRSLYRPIILLGLLLGLAALTKQSALAFLPVAALAVVGGALQQPQPRRAAWTGLVLLGIVVALVGGWWYFHNTLAYSDPLGFQPHQPPTRNWQPTLSLMLRQLGQAFQGYWGAFGWSLILVDPIIYILIGIFLLLGLLGLLAFYFTRPPIHNTQYAIRNTQYASRITHHASRITVAPSALLALALLCNLSGLILWLWRTSAPYGRLLFPTLGPLAVLLVLGWRRWLKTRRGWPFAAVISLLLALYAFLVPGLYLQPAYAHPVVPNTALDGATPLDVQFEGGLNLLAYWMDQSEAEPGEVVTISLYWQALNALERDLMTFVQLAPSDPEQRVAGLDVYLGTSRHPTSVWQAGKVVRQIHHLQLPADVSAPALYWFLIGVYDPSTAERLPGNADGLPLPDDTLRLGPLRAVSSETPVPSHRVDYRFGEAIRLVGYGIDRPHPDALAVTLYWEAQVATQTHFVAFVHLLDAHGQRIAQDDSPPRQGEYPTWAWEAGDRVPDPHLLTLPSSVTGPFTLLVGLYRPEDGTRPPVFDQNGQRMPDDLVPLPSLSSLPAVDGSAGGDPHAE